MKNCPFCAEEIQDEATVCRYCGKNLNAPQPMDTSQLKTKLDEVIQKYIVYGYTIASRTEMSAIMERFQPFSWGILILYILLFFPLAIAYAFPGARGKLSVSLSVGMNGEVIEYGGTIAEMEKAKKRSKITGWVVLGIFGVIILCVIGSSLFTLFSQ
ncbi:MAG: zinc ribbon domain-containing protein [Anaerolineaceae bacterium]|nr:zinc ribbon domain-containing protein [Anaerolineaceae bacterium]